MKKGPAGPPEPAQADLFGEVQGGARKDKAVPSEPAARKPDRSEYPWRAQPPALSAVVPNSAPPAKVPPAPALSEAPASVPSAIAGAPTTTTAAAPRSADAAAATGTTAAAPTGAAFASTGTTTAAPSTAATVPLGAGAASSTPVAAPPETARRVILTVGELTRQIKGTLERGFARVCVRGEISGYRGPNPRGHLYFSVKDAEATLDARIWASAAQRLRFKLRDGMEVVVEGSIDLYEPQGRYSLIVQRIEPVGEGALALAFQQLKEKLQAEGLFGEQRRRAPRPIPSLPRRIGVVTSRTGAALQDFLRVLHGRHPRLSVLLCDARVQGEGAAAEVVSALQRLGRTDVDVIVVTRGGGSVEDLWTFNEESVARAIHASPVPVVSAIGHEVDFTIADFVADLRAPTPSAAAERLAPVLRDLELHLVTTRGRLRKAVERHVLADRQRLHRLGARVADPRRVLAQKRLHLSEDAERLARVLRQKIRALHDRQRALQERLHRLRPQARLVENRDRLRKLQARLVTAFREQLRRRVQGLAKARGALQRSSPAGAVRSQRARLVALRQALVHAARQRADQRRRRFVSQQATLDALSPLAVTARGYGITLRGDDGHVVRRASEVAVGETIAVRVLSPEVAARLRDEQRSPTLADCDEISAQVTGLKPGA